MHTNQVYTDTSSGNLTENKISCRCWHYRLTRIIFATFIFLTVIAVTIGLVLRFIVLVPKKPEISTTPATIQTSEHQKV
jgi:hypothetical protein